MEAVGPADRRLRFWCATSRAPRWPLLVGLLCWRATLALAEQVPAESPERNNPPTFQPAAGTPARTKVPRQTARGDAPIDHGPRTAPPQVALTFDACSGPPPGKLDEGVVHALEAVQAKATFFLGGRWAEQDPSRVARLRANPRFELESHSYHHPHLLTLSDADLRSEISKAQTALTPLLGHPPTYLRAPYGEADDRVVKVARALGVTVIGFDLASGDPDPHFDKKTLVRWVLQQVKPGSIVVFHANGRGWHTAEALPTILEALQKRGYTLVTVDELLHPSAAPEPAPIPAK